MAVVTAAHRIDEIAAESDQAPIETLQLQLHRRDLQAMLGPGCIGIGGDGGLGRGGTG